MKRTAKNRLRFSLAFLILSMLVAGVSIPTIQYIQQFANSKPIQHAIDEFESRKYEHYDLMAPLTSGEIFESLESKLANKEQLPHDVSSTIKQILVMKRMPTICEFDMVTYRSGNQPGVDSIIIRLQVTKNDVINIRTIEATSEMQPGFNWQQTYRDSAE